MTIFFKKFKFWCLFLLNSAIKLLWNLVKTFFLIKEPKILPEKFFLGSIRSFQKKIWPKISDFLDFQFFGAFKWTMQFFWTFFAFLGLLIPQNTNETYFLSERIENINRKKNLYGLWVCLERNMVQNVDFRYLSQKMHKIDKI